jgi:hypothetical protein
MRKPTRLQIFFARWWLSCIWFVNVIVWPLIIMGGYLGNPSPLGSSHPIGGPAEDVPLQLFSL